MQSDLFPTVELRYKPEEPTCFRFIVGYWPRGKYWKIWPTLYSKDGDDIIAKNLAAYSENGWSNLAVLRLPPELWKLEPPPASCQREP